MGAFEDVRKFIDESPSPLKERLIDSLPELTEIIVELEDAIGATSDQWERINSEELWEANRKLQRFFSEFGVAAAVKISAEGEYQIILCDLRKRLKGDEELNKSLLTDPEFKKFLKDINMTPIN